MITPQILKDYVVKLELERYNGTIELRVQNGRIVMLEKKQSMKVLDIQNDLCNKGDK